MKDCILIKKWKYDWCEEFLYSLSFNFGDLSSYNFLRFETIKNYFYGNIEDEEIANKVLNCSNIEEVVKILQENIVDIEIIFKDCTKGE